MDWSDVLEKILQVIFIVLSVIWRIICAIFGFLGRIISDVVSGTYKIFVGHLSRLLYVFLAALIIGLFCLIFRR